MKTFPFILHDILSDPESQNIIAWMPHGRSWKVMDKEKLAMVICPTYFSHSKFEHFTRSVNGWGFKPYKKDGPDCRSFCHQYFLRGEIELCRRMKRSTYQSYIPEEANGAEEGEKVVTNNANEKPHFQGIRHKLPGAFMPYHHWQLQFTSQIQPMSSVLHSHHSLDACGHVPYYLYVVPYVPHNIDPRTHPPLFPPIVQGGYHPYAYEYVKGHFSTIDTVTSSYPWYPSAHFQISPCHQNGLSLGDTSRSRSKSFQHTCPSHATDASVSVYTPMQMSGPNPPLTTSYRFHTRPCRNRGQRQWNCKDRKYIGNTASLSRPRLSLISGHNFVSASAYPMDNGRVHLLHSKSLEEVVVGRDGETEHMKPVKSKFSTEHGSELAEKLDEAFKRRSSKNNAVVTPIAQSIETQRYEALQLRSSIGKDDIHSFDKKTSLISTNMHHTEEIQDIPAFSHPQSSILLHQRPFPNPMLYTAGDEHAKSALGSDKAPSSFESFGENSFMFAMAQAQAQGHNATSASAAVYVNSTEPPMPMSEHEGVERGNDEGDEAYEEESERNSASITENQMSLIDGNDINDFADHRGAEVEGEIDPCRAHGDSSTIALETCGDEAVRLWNENKRRNPAGSSYGHPAKLRKISPNTQNHDINHPQFNPFQHLDGCEVSMAHANIGYCAGTPVALDRIETSNCGMPAPSMEHCDRENKGKVQCEQGLMTESEGKSQYKPYSGKDISHYSRNIEFEDDDMQYFASIFSSFGEEK